MKDANLKQEVWGGDCPHEVPWTCACRSKVFGRKVKVLACTSGIWPGFADPERTPTNTSVCGTGLQDVIVLVGLTGIFL